MLPLTVQEVIAESRGAMVRIETELGSGSGFIIDPDGLILTNNHVIKGATTVSIHLEDGTSYSGVIHGRDLIRDLALVKIAADNLKTLGLGDVSRVLLGSDLMALGYPLGVTGLTTTVGKTSSIKYDPSRNVGYVQTDTTINPGNSGGPLVDMQGNVIGVVTSKIVSDVVEDFGLAISINTVRLYLDRLKGGEVITN